MGRDPPKTLIFGKITSSRPVYNDHLIFQVYKWSRILEPDDDVACARLAHIECRLRRICGTSEKCSWEIATVNGIQGYRATGPSGKSIFFPAIQKWFHLLISAVHYWSRHRTTIIWWAYWQETAWTLYLYVNTSTHSTNRMEDILAIQSERLARINEEILSGLFYLYLLAGILLSSIITGVEFLISGDDYRDSPCRIYCCDRCSFRI